jgi:hypothetical protein
VSSQGTETTSTQPPMATARHDTNLTPRETRSALNLQGTSWLNMDDYIASRDGRASDFAALRDSDSICLAEEHFAQAASRRAFGRLLEAATDKATAIVFDEMASKNGEICALRSCLITWRNRQADAQEAANVLQDASTPLTAKELGIVCQVLYKAGKNTQAYEEAWELARSNKEAYLEVKSKAGAMRTFRTWYKCSKTHQEIMSRNYEKIQRLKAIDASIMTKIKFRQAWTNWSGMEAYDIEDPIVYIRDDGAKVKDKSSDQFWLVELSSGREVLIPMEGIPQKTLELMRDDAETPLVTIDQLAEDNRNAVLLNAQAIARSPTLQAQQEAKRIAKEAIQNRKFKSNSVRKAPSPSQLMKIAREKLQVKRSLVDRSRITRKKHHAEKEALDERAFEATRRSSLSLEAAKHHLKEAKRAVSRSRSPNQRQPHLAAHSNTTQIDETASSAATKIEAMSSSEHDDELFDVQEVLDHVGEARELQYFCSFVDYGPEENSWVEASTMNGCETLIRRYWESKDAERDEYWKNVDILQQEEDKNTQTEQEAATEIQGPRRSLRLTLEPEAANAEREPQPASGIDTALGDAFNTYTRSNGEHATKSPLSEAVEEELGAHAVSPVKSRDLFAKRRATQSTAAEESE